MSSLDAKSMQILILIASGASRVYVVLLYADIRTRTEIS